MSHTTFCIMKQKKFLALKVPIPICLEKLGWTEGKALRNLP
jgi:hypothetical protein